MSGARGSITVRRPYADVAEALARPAEIMALIDEFGRTAFIHADDDGSQQWDVFIVLGTMYVGGRARVAPPGGGRLVWASVSGIRNETRIEAAPAGEAATRVVASVDFRLEGRFSGAVASRLVRGIVGRYINALLERLRHHLEYES